MTYDKTLFNESTVNVLVSRLASTRAERESLYKHFHQHPELSMQEVETSARIAAELDARQIPYSRVGKTGIVAVIQNGIGPVVALRGDIDALPMKETSGKDYASQATQLDEATGAEVPTAHACGHDFHTVCLLGALDAFHTQRDQWSGTLVGVFQPGEETASGAKDMVAHDIASAMPVPDVYLGQHVLGTLPGGAVGTRVGPVLSSAFSVKVGLTGKGSHGSMPELGVDPVVVAASIIVRLQTIVAREVAASETAVVTVGAIHAGTKSNIIPDSAELLINTRAYSSATSSHLKEAIERIVRAECVAARCPVEPTFTYYDEYPLTNNDAQATERVRGAFDSYFGDASMDLAPVPASEDFSIIPDALGAPYSYWGVGGFANPETAPGNHNPAFAPDLQPTLDRGSEALIVAACAWLSSGEGAE
ncbi:amidohydrolase [Corynebacterium breve]|uniref:Amidohydrolase n=1 Tax=Corynebacterium breve TaxID=3049799 RepID=A0ABY8VIS2_9CORY|nr:amidohydrolase [Corynebacterium breve]WIM68104.1 amidohydrolase [Corynebacterium breve]